MKFVVLALSMFLSSFAVALPVIDPARGLYLDGPITRGTIAPLKAGLDAMIADEKSTAPITIVMDSPGGEVVSGMAFISSMRAARARGLKINCYVTGLSASMAFLILTECDSRSALETSFLLWHGVRIGNVGQPVTAKLAAQLAEDLAQMDELAMDMLVTSLHRDLSLPLIQHHFDVETLWSGLVLQRTAPHFMSVSRAFPDIVKLLPKFKYNNGQQSFFGMLSNQIILISPKVWNENGRVLPNNEE